MENNVIDMQEASAIRKAGDAFDRLIDKAAGTITDWLEYGSAIDALSCIHPSDEAFGKAIKAHGLDERVRNGKLHTISRPVRRAAVWAATKTDQLTAVMAMYPDLEVTPKGGFRPLHERWLAHEKAAKAEPRPEKPAERPEASPAPQPAPAPDPTPEPRPEPPVAQPAPAPSPEPEPDIIIIEPAEDDDPDTDANHNLWLSIGYDMRVKGYNREDIKDKYGKMNHDAISGACRYYDGYMRARGDIKIEATVLTKTSQKILERHIAYAERQIAFDTIKVFNDQYDARIERDFSKVMKRCEEVERLHKVLTSGKLPDPLSSFRAIAQLCSQDHADNRTLEEYRELTKECAYLMGDFRQLFETQKAVNSKNAFTDLIARKRAEHEAKLAARGKRRK